MYGTYLGVYLRSTWIPASQRGVCASILFTMVNPMMNPFLYSLRNRDMERAVRMLLCSMLTSW
jgi:olfactory receptor